MTAAIDLFAGPGGWDVAAVRLGIAPLGIDLDEAACRTARQAGHARIRVDIAGQDPSKYAEHGRNLLIASPPCQAFSAAGKGKGRADTSIILDGVQMMWGTRTPSERADVAHSINCWLEDDRAALVLEPLRWALDLLPEALAWEQVPAVLPLWEAMAAVLRSDGYNVATGILHAEQYDVPQTRRRAVLVASRVHDVHLPEPRLMRCRPGVPRLDSSGLPLWISMRKAIGWGWAHRPARTICGDRAPRWIYEQGAGSYATGHTVENGGRWTVEDAAVLQGFPRDYPWQGNKSQRFEQISNAVPPPLAWHVLRAALGMPAEAWPGFAAEAAA